MSELSIDATNAMDFYAKNNVVFVTGGTGFIGMALIEKVLRSIPQVKKIYVLMRVSGKTSLQQRLQKDIIENRIFDTLKADFPNESSFSEMIHKKIVPVQGDIIHDNLGLCADDLAMVRGDTNVFVHIAASIGYTDPLRTALNFNTHGTLRALNLAKTMSHLTSFVQTSTAYVDAHLPSGRFSEKFYPFPLGDPQEMFEVLQKMSESEIASYERDVILKTYPNTYIFTKSLTEQLIRSQFEELSLPIVIVRPSMVSPALHEPVPGWTQGRSGLNALIINCGLGRVQEWYGDEDKCGELVPVDTVCKALLSAAVTANRKAVHPLIYNCTSDQVFGGLTFGVIANHIAQYWRAASTSRKRASNDIRFHFYTKGDFEKRFQQRFAKEIQVSKQPNGKATKDILNKIHLNATTYHIYFINEWLFDMSNFKKLDETTPSELYCGLKHGMDWSKYLHNSCLGVHEYVLKENVDRSIAIPYIVRSVQRVYNPTEESSETISARL
ncbi:cyclin-dependent kinase inhibitor far1 [Haplosporangium sp. Z 27]|nr:cyclin-dependent kinase inhibitor far1 [Haplosporangium sp. Z 27]